mmetsp:Transcript_50748/g.99194  ORF Transcript_50748/g.99194 Transcript_50748/m.99194 type:complete len:628 (+) Transcript_50748:174-2057(+)
MIPTIPDTEWPSLDLDDSNAADFFSQGDGLGLMISENLGTGVEGSRTDICNILSRFNSSSDIPNFGNFYSKNSGSAANLFYFGETLNDVPVLPTSSVIPSVGSKRALQAENSSTPASDALADAAGQSPPKMAKFAKEKTSSLNACAVTQANTPQNNQIQSQVPVHPASVPSFSGAESIDKLTPNPIPAITTSLNPLNANNWKASQNPLSPVITIPVHTVSVESSPVPIAPLAPAVSKPAVLPSNVVKIVAQQIRPVKPANILQTICPEASSGSTTEDNDDELFPFNTKVPDTSTAHIAALTSPNWVEACTAAATQYPLCTTTTGKRGKRRNLSVDERAKQNRDRNREHARNTRLRKKAYVEELKRTLLAMVAERDSAELRRKVTEEQLKEQKEVRFAVMKEFMNYRGRNESLARWSAILDSSFVMKLPVTPYRKMVNNGRIAPNRTTPDENSFLDPSERILRGVSEVVADSKFLVNFLFCVGKNSPAWEMARSISQEEHCERPTMEFECDKTSFIADGEFAFLRWSAISVGLKKQGANAELTIRGTMRSQFCPVTNKLKSVELHFDTAPIIKQLEIVTNVLSSNGVRDTRYAQFTVVNSQVISSSEESADETVHPVTSRKMSRAKTN